MKNLTLTILTVIAILILLTGCNQEVVTEGDNLFSEGLVAVSYLGDINYMSPEGEVVIKTDYENAFNFSEGLALVQENDKWGYIDKEGKEIIEPKYENAKSYSENLAAIKIDEKWGFID